MEIKEVPPIFRVQVLKREQKERECNKIEKKKKELYKMPNDFKGKLIDIYA